MSNSIETRLVALGIDQDHGCMVGSLQWLRTCGSRLWAIYRNLPVIPSRVKEVMPMKRSDCLMGIAVEVVDA
jgi:hypothetical protein